MVGTGTGAGTAVGDTMVRKAEYGMVWQNNQSKAIQFQAIALHTVPAAYHSRTHKVLLPTDTQLYL